MWKDGVWWGILGKEVFDCMGNVINRWLIFSIDFFLLFINFVVGEIIYLFFWLKGGENILSMVVFIVMFFIVGSGDGEENV